MKHLDELCVAVRWCRDSLLASLLDGVRASGNRDVCVKMAPTQRGQRWGLLSMPVDEEVESLHLKFLAAPPSESELGITRATKCICRKIGEDLFTFPPSRLLSLDGNFADAVFRFNANISYSGVLHAVTQDVSVSFSQVWQLVSISLLVHFVY